MGDLSTKVGTFSGTRPWRSFHDVPASILKVYDELRDALAAKGEDHKLLVISKALLQQVVDFMKFFNAIFDQLEFSDEPTLHYVAPTYYTVIDHCAAKPTDLPAIKILKKNIAFFMEKYWKDVAKMHLLASELSSDFKGLLFVKDQKYRQKVC